MPSDNRRRRLVGRGLAGFVGIVLIGVIVWLVLTRTDLLARSEEGSSLSDGPASGLGSIISGDPVSQEAAGSSTSSESGQEAATVAEGQSIVESLSQALSGPEPSPYPVGIRQGLSSLDVYRVRMSLSSAGPTPDEFTSMETEIRWDRVGDARHVHTENKERTADSNDVNSTIQDQYQIGLESCSIDYDEDGAYAEMEQMEPLERDFLEATAVLFDFTISPEAPTFVGEETFSGVAARHYTFRVLGLGDYSGADVLDATGEYWVAVDGNYLLKYALTLDARTGPEGDPQAEAVRMTYLYELLDLNQPQTIAFPAECFVESP